MTENDKKEVRIEFRPQDWTELSTQNMANQIEAYHKLVKFFRGLESDEIPVENIELVLQEMQQDYCLLYSELTHYAEVKSKEVEVLSGLSYSSVINLMFNNTKEWFKL